MNQIELMNGTSSSPPKITQVIHTTPAHGGDQFGATGSLTAKKSDMQVADIDPKQLYQPKP